MQRKAATAIVAVACVVVGVALFVLQHSALRGPRGAQFTLTAAAVHASIASALRESAFQGIATAALFSAAQNNGGNLDVGGGAGHNNSNNSAPSAPVTQAACAAFVASTSCARRQPSSSSSDSSSDCASSSSYIAWVPDVSSSDAQLAAWEDATSSKLSYCPSGDAGCTQPQPQPRDDGKALPVAYTCSATTATTTTTTTATTTTGLPIMFNLAAADGETDTRMQAVAQASSSNSMAATARPVRLPGMQAMPLVLAFHPIASTTTARVVSGYVMQAVNVAAVVTAAQRQISGGPQLGVHLTTQQGERGN